MVPREIADMAAHDAYVTKTGLFKVNPCQVNGTQNYQIFSAPWAHPPEPQEPIL